MAEPLNRSLARGLDMLALLSDAPQGLALHEIARALDMPKSSAFNLLRTLLEKQYVRCRAESGRYTLSPRLFELGAATLHATPVESVLRSHMREIFAACNETVHCGVPDGADVVYIDKIESTHSIRMTSRVGLRMPLYCTAMGRAILACMPDEAVRALLRGQTLRAFTPHTLTSMDAVLAELRAVRAQGYATEVEETNENVCCVGVAIRTREGAPQYAVSISMPLFRASERGMPYHAQLLLHAREQIEQRLHLL